MLMLAILPWPYEYYKLLRVVVFTASLFFAYGFHKYGEDKWKIKVLIGISLIYNPVFTIHLSRELWGVLNIISAYIYYKILPDLSLKKIIQKRAKSIEKTQRILTDDQKKNKQLK